jgi:hypothetical protein
MVVPQTLVVEFHGHISVVVQGLVEKGQDDGIAPHGRHPL